LLTIEDGELVLLRPSPRQPKMQTDRWVVKRSYFRLRGVQHTLLMLSDVSKALREEERLAWERLIRVLGHEINNSLTPIKSIAGSLRGRLAPAESSADFERGLAVIENRAESLNRFLQAYRQLMGLPVPKLQNVSLAALVDRVVHLEARLAVTVVASPDVTVYVDPDQIEQALINLVRNAVEAALSPEATHNAACVRLEWAKAGEELVISIIDSGLGLTNAENLFVPFYTTKPEGTGIGLILAQQIAEALSIDVTYDRTKLAQDDIATATATVHNNLGKTANMVMVDLGIPPGFDLLSEDLQAFQEKTANAKTGHLEKFSLTATQAILYFNALAPKQTVAIHFRLRAKYPIRAKTFQSRVYEYYDPDVSATARPIQLEVKSR
jgi:anti-sigma regulatory factor (Ser/Thr protein kinase)